VLGSGIVSETLTITGGSRIGVMAAFNARVRHPAADDTKEQA
jgi:hypothetical protein